MRVSAPAVPNYLSGWGEWLSNPTFLKSHPTLLPNQHTEQC
jgi:hypothetical protein